MSVNKKQKAYRFGKAGEALTVAVLRLKGYRIITRGSVSGRGTGAGEVDIIARRGGVLAFVEVKARTDGSVEVLTRRQQERITRAAAFYIAKNPRFAHDYVRFDVAVVRPWRWPRIIENAWQSDGF